MNIVVSEYEKDVLDLLVEFHADFGLQWNKEAKPHMHAGSKNLPPNLNVSFQKTTLISA